MHIPRLDSPSGTSCRHTPPVSASSDSAPSPLSLPCSGFSSAPTQLFELAVMGRAFSHRQELEPLDFHLQRDGPLGLVWPGPGHTPCPQILF